MAWLGEELPKDQQEAATPFSPRCVKDVLEEGLFAARRDLLTTLDVVFMDTTSLYFEGAGGQTLVVLKKELEDRLDAAGAGARASWPAAIADLDSLTETEVEQDGKRLLLR